MKKYIYYIGLIMLIAVAATFFASSSPDALESVAEKLGLRQSLKN